MFQYKDIPNNTTQTTTLTELRKYVLYHIQVLAYTRLGDGALSSPPVHVRTFEDGKLNYNFVSGLVIETTNSVKSQCSCFTVMDPFIPFRARDFSPL
jgi:hypothetical protein